MKNRVDGRGLFDPKIVKFLSTGVLNTAFGYTVYAALVYAKVPYLTALLISTVSGVIFNYFSFGRLVFHGNSGWFVFFKFLISYGTIYGANAALLQYLTSNMLFNAYVAQAICVPPSVVLSWLLMNYWVYKKD